MLSLCYDVGASLGAGIIGVEPPSARRLAESPVLDTPILGRGFSLPGAFSLLKCELLLLKCEPLSLIHERFTHVTARRWHLLTRAIPQ